MGLGSKNILPVLAVSAFALLSIGGLLSSVRSATAQSMFGPSFDCRAANRPDERTICGDPVLARLDTIYTRNFEVARQLRGPSTTSLARSWNHDRSNCGFNRDCILRVQIAAIESFQRLGGPLGVPSELRPAVLAQAVAVAPTQTTQIVVQPNNSAETNELRSQVAQLAAIVKANQAPATVALQPTQAAQSEIIDADEDSLSAISDRFDKAAANHASYSTPTRPDDMDLGRTARAASEAFPRIPFYIPGTRESGRFWVEPRVSDTGSLFYDMTFVDPKASVDQRRAVIDLSQDQLERMRIAIAKLGEWSRIAHQNEVRRSYRKRIDCFPDASCPREGEKVEGKSSTEIVFIVNEDGSTAGRVQRNKGRYDEGYNVSIKSARLLASYLRYVQSRGERDFRAGTRTTADLDVMFK